MRGTIPVFLSDLAGMITRTLGGPAASGGPAADDGHGRRFHQRPGGHWPPSRLASTLIVLSISSVFWFLMNIPFQPRFLPVPYTRSPWMLGSLALNAVFGLALLPSPKTRPLGIIPFMFTLFPLAFIAMTFLGELLRALIPGTESARGLDWKFAADCLFFLTELAFMFIFLGLSRTGNPFALKPPLTVKKSIRFGETVFILGVLTLTVLLLRGESFPLGRFLRLLKYQIPFALLLGLKEELFFRWILVRTGERLLGSRIISIAFMALLWGGYHFFFGEGVGTGFWPAFWVVVVSFWWSLLSYHYNSIWSAWLGHTAVELYGFYLMYSPFLK
jgi:hypothetical protein